jgi:hypothetical protein
MWELYAMWSWFLVFAADELFESSTAAAFATFAVIAVGAVGCWAGGGPERQLGPRADCRGDDGGLGSLRADDRRRGRDLDDRRQSFWRSSGASR